MTFSITGCTVFAPLSYASVTVKSGATVIATGVADASGAITLDVGSAGTYTVEVTKAPRFSVYSASRSLACGQTYAISMASNIATGYVCCGFGEPISKTLYITDANGTWSLVWITGCLWRACYGLATSGVTLSPSCVATPGPINLGIGHAFTPVGFSTRTGCQWAIGGTPYTYLDSGCSSNQQVYTGPCSLGASAEGTYGEVGYETSVAPEGYNPFSMSGPYTILPSSTASPVGSAWLVSE